MHRNKVVPQQLNKGKIASIKASQPAKVHYRGSSAIQVHGKNCGWKQWWSKVPTQSRPRYRYQG